MEDHDNENVVLELDNQRLNVNKKKLINKSQYFAALLSEKFIDHTLPVHKIEYDIPVISLQDFINWINSDDRNVTIDAENIDVGRLLTLVKINDIYQIKDEFKLTETIIDILQNRNLTFQETFDAWMMGERANSKMLRDLYFSVCLDRFTELPKNLICELSEENFLQLIKNTNLRIPKTIDAKTYLFDIAQEWLKVNKKDKFTIPLDNLEKTGPKVCQSIIFCNKQNYFDKYEFFLYCWDGNKSFELATFKLPEELINNQGQIEEFKIIARGHNLYFIGGEFYIRPKIFNTKVWRYSLITKKWHFETTMPRERSKMIAAFVQNKLLLAGGYGFNYEKLNSLDIYDVHKGTWTEGMDMPFTYINSLDCFNVVDKYLICFFNESKQYIYIYNSEINYWCKVEKKINKNYINMLDLYMTAPIIKQFKTASYYVDVMNQDRLNLKNFECDSSEYKQKIYEKYAEYLQIEEKYKEENNFDMYFCFINYRESKIYDYYMLFCSKNENVEYKLIQLKKGPCLPWRSVPISPNAFQSFFWGICSTMFSNLMDPADLYVK